MCLTYIKQGMCVAFDMHLQVTVMRVLVLQLTRRWPGYSGTCTAYTQHACPIAG